MLRIKDVNLRIQIFGSLIKYGKIEILEDMNSIHRFGYKEEAEAFASKEGALDLDEIFDANFKLLSHTIEFITKQPFDYETDGTEEYQQIRHYINNYKLTQKQIDNLKHIVIGGWNIGDECVWPKYNEEKHSPGYFDIQSLEGIGILKNLEDITFMGLFNDKLDLMPLLENKKVKYIDAGEDLEKNNEEFFNKYKPNK